MQKVTRALMHEYAKELSNWGRWGSDDELGALNYVTPAAIVEAAQLVRKGKVFSLAIPFDATGPQVAGWGGRTNPVRSMIATGTDAALGKQEQKGIAYADDVVSMPLQCATHWDALGHIFYRYRDENGQMQTKMWNGYPATLVGSAGCEKCGIEKAKDRFVGRGVLLDVARYKGREYLPDGFGITTEDLEGCARAENVTVKSGDFLLLHTGQMAKCMKENWGNYPAGEAPGLEFETLKWLHRVEVAAVCSDTWGIEVRPNRTDENIFQPWHQITIPIMGVTHGEIFYLKELAADCAVDGQYDFLFVAPPIPFTYGAGSPINPLAIK